MGFPGMGLAAVVRAADDVPEAYACGVTQLLSQLVGAAATQLSGCAVGFKICAGCSAGATLLMLLAPFPPHPPSDAPAIVIELNEKRGGGKDGLVRS